MPHLKNRTVSYMSNWKEDVLNLFAKEVLILQLPSC